MMKVEIERKFLVRGDSWRALATGVPFRQGYLQTRPCTVRVRIEGVRGVLTIKGHRQGIARDEYEYPIPFEDAERMLDTLIQTGIVEKNRYTIPYEGFLWEVDEFLGDNAGLVVAEIELEDEAQPFSRPEWVGEEITSDHRYTNAALSSCPFCRW